MLAKKQKTILLLIIISLIFLVGIPDRLNGNGLGVFTAQAQSGLTGVEIPGNTGLPDPAGGIAQIITNLLVWLLGIVGVVALISFAISGLQYFMAAGDDGSMKTAKQNMQYSIYGVIIALSGVVVIKAVDTALRAVSLF